MNPLTSIAIILMDVKASDKGERFGAAVTIPGRNTELHSLKEWDEVIRNGGSTYDGLDLEIAAALERYLGKAPPAATAKDLPTRLVDLALGFDTVLFTDGRGDPYARVRSGDHTRILPIDGAFGKWLSSEFYRAEGKAPSSEALRSAINILQGRATYDGEVHELHIRVAELERDRWYYLSDDRRRAVRIEAKGWEIIDEPPILFRHLSHMRPQDEPERGKEGALDRILDLMNLQGPDRTMFKIMLITDLVPGIAHCGLSLSGHQGCGKTLIMKMEKQLIDPSSMEIFPFIKDEQELLRVLDRHHIVPFDNVGLVTRERSDVLCQAITGVSLATRKKYTDDEDYIRSFKRIVRMNGINNEIRASDLLSRMILMELTPIGDRRPESELWEDFRRLRPAAFGELLDLFSRTIGVYESFTPSKAPRMADWHEWGEAAAVALGMTQEAFVELFSRYEEKQDTEALEQSNLAPLLEGLAREREKESLGAWVGKAPDLLEVLTVRAEESGVNVRDREWPKSSVELGRKITPLVPNLLTRGVVVTRGLTFNELRKARPDLLTKDLKGRGYGPKDRMIVIELELPEQG